ncbi:MAG: hypothetical protein GEV12_07050 [Micromonosporaceae bacterium]|nr:hypothetical protein [Micromonosporaceae bacterium]
MAATLALLAAVLTLAPGPVAAVPEPDPKPTSSPDRTADPADPADNQSQFESATVVSGLSMLVERPDERLVAERDTTYTIAVNNSGKDSEKLTIRVTVPPWMSDPDPLDGGWLGDGFVDWPLTVAPGQVATMRLTGAYASPERDAPTRMAFTACALDAGDDEPIVCDTDIAQLAPAGPGTRWWLVGTLLAVAAALAGAVGYRVRRRRAHPPAPAASG